jgi:hypothetical protein
VPDPFATAHQSRGVFGRLRQRAGNAQEREMFGRQAGPVARGGCLFVRSACRREFSRRLTRNRHYVRVTMPR